MRIWAIALATATVLLFASAARARSVPTLGVGGIDPAASGFGQVKPRTIDFGGDATSIVSDVKWRSWGGARAVGHGRAIWVWPGWCVACGGVQLTATVVAFDRTTCRGHRAYSYVEWFFPSRGQSFDRRLAGENICTGALPTIAAKMLNCGHVTLHSGGVTALAKGINMYDSPISCQAARQFVAHSGAARYLGRNARYTVDGWWCGSQLTPILPGLQYVTCERGDFTNVQFQLKRR
jgi:hypothetical protein